MAMAITPSTDCNFINSIVPMPKIDPRFSSVILAVEMNPQLCSFYKFLERWSIIKIIVTRSVIWFRGKNTES